MDANGVSNLFGPPGAMDGKIGVLFVLVLSTTFICDARQLNSIVGGTHYSLCCFNIIFFFCYECSQLIGI